MYFAPEVILAIQGEPVSLSCKLDIFSLGVLFHQYLTGTLPAFDMEQFSCVGEAVAFGAPVAVSGTMPEGLYPVICRMLSANPAERPSASEVYSAFMSVLWSGAVATAPAETEAAPAPTTTMSTAETVFTGDAPATGGWQGLGDL